MFVVGVDCGTASVRACLFDISSCRMVRRAERPIEIRRDESGLVFDQSSHNIWEQTCGVVNEVVQGEKGVVGISFDATCSLVRVDSTTTLKSEEEWNVIMWCDHRAQEETDWINENAGDLLGQFGGKVSVEMQTPKLLWARKHLPQFGSLVWLDLVDFLCSSSCGGGKVVRCHNSIECKWGSKDLLEKCDLLSCLGDYPVLLPGQRCGYLCDEAKRKMGFSSELQISVAAGQIDAYCGVVGTLCLGSEVRHNQNVMVVIGGTSTCHMVTVKSEQHVAGVWGPYHNVVMNDSWTLEGGQSASSSLLQRVMSMHPDYDPGADLSHLQVNALDTVHLHINPDFHGNRSPLADPHAYGGIIGLTMNHPSLAQLYCATIQSMCYTTRHIVEQMSQHQVQVQCLMCCGGLSRNTLWLQQHADITGLEVIASADCDLDLTLVGASLLAAVGAGLFCSIEEAIEKVRLPARHIHPAQNDKTTQYHNAKYDVFRWMQQHMHQYRQRMQTI